MIAILIVICILIIAFFTVFQKRKNQLLLDQLKQKQEFEEELTKTQQEIQEETLKHVGRELHDNVGQMLVLATMQMKGVAKMVGEEAKPKVANVSQYLKESLNEVRALSKSLNSDVIFNLGFDEAIKNEVERINKLEEIKAVLIINGEKVNFENRKDEIILFRILQEFTSNTLKYAEAETLDVKVDYTDSFLSISLEDDGKGFNISDAEYGSGLTNMKKRAEFVNADFQYNSQPEKGTQLRLKYPYRTL